MFGPVASDPTVFRLVDTLAVSGSKALAAIRGARSQVREPVWELAGAQSPAVDGQVIVDIDGVLVLTHSEKQDATATWKKNHGHYPLVVYVDHGQARPGQARSGKPVAALPQPGNAGFNTAAGPMGSAQIALAELPELLRRTQILVRTDSAAGAHRFLDRRSGRSLQPRVPVSTNAESRPVNKLTGNHEFETSAFVRLSVFRCGNSCGRYVDCALTDTPTVPLAVSLSP
ncbi:hypothetical protein BIV24_21875 [Streptomyces colonosanans]|uniref:Transposase DDE domain-containing protein n=1 Tax=Streptomyces colonosanans TaxID=1428652 RepID=A0A1S2P3Z5_9ACTN|nr:hypothetical protein BIV24_21875 [Streptomyces colonosanans]